MIIQYLLFFLVIFQITLNEAYKILVVFPFPANSHNILGNNVVRHLLNAHHEVTYITPFPLKDFPPNLHQIDVSSAKNAFSVDSVNIHKLMKKEVGFDDEDILFRSIFSLAEAVIRSENVQKLIQDPLQKFDLVVNEYMFNEIYAGFAGVFGCPYIWILPYEPYTTVINFIDGPLNPAYAANLVSDNVPPFTLKQRLQELWISVQSYVYRTLVHARIQEKVYEEAFGPAVIKRRGSLVPFDKLKYNASMILGNTHPATGIALSLPQSYKSIAGYFIEENVKPLPDDLKMIMDNATHGVIYFSLGSNLKSKDLPNEIKVNLIKKFSQLKETVIWKFEEELDNLPKNVYVKKWAPQHSILAHPNCKLFITHGGLLSITESVHFGVPIIGIPVYVDQFNNVNRLVTKGAGLRVDISYSLADDLEIAIQKILRDHRFTERAKMVSMIFHDRPVSPGTELVHWVEHVVRTGGALHLRSPAVDLPFYQKMYLDFVLMIIAAFLLVKSCIKRLMSISNNQEGKKSQGKKKLK